MRPVLRKSIFQSLHISQFMVNVFVYCNCHSFPVNLLTHEYHELEEGFRSRNLPVGWSYKHVYYFGKALASRSQWPRGLRRRSTAARLLRSWVRIPPWKWMIVCCEGCVLSGRGLCDGLITRPEDS